MLKELIIFFLSLLFLLLLLEIFKQVVNELIVYSNHVLFDPSIHWPFLLQVVDVVLYRLSCPYMWDCCHLIILILRGLYGCLHSCSCALFTIICRCTTGTIIFAVPFGLHLSITLCVFGSLIRCIACCHCHIFHNRVPKDGIFVIRHFISHLQNLRQFPTHVPIYSKNVFLLFDSTCKLFILLVPKVLCLELLDDASIVFSAGVATAS